MRSGRGGDHRVKNTSIIHTPKQPQQCPPCLTKMVFRAECSLQSQRRVREVSSRMRLCCTGSTQTLDLPTTGRLYEKCLELLAGADIQFRRQNRLDVALVQNHPMAL